MFSSRLDFFMRMCYLYLYSTFQIKSLAMIYYPFSRDIRQIPFLTRSKKNDSRSPQENSVSLRLSIPRDGTFLASNALEGEDV